MKKLLFASFFTVAFALSASAFDGILPDTQVVYSPAANSWSTGAMAQDRIVLTKKMSNGSGGYSEYYFKSGKIAIPMTSNYEFLFDGKLISINNSDLKYNKIVYSNGKFKEQPLTNEELSKIFPDTAIVKVSEFNDSEITIKKDWFKKKNILLLNDTKDTFYKFSYKPKNAGDACVKGYVTLRHPGTITFSHYGDKESMLKIHVKN